MRNKEIRIRLKETGIKLYEVAAHLGVSQATMTRRLYFELDTADKNELLTVIDEMAAEKNKEAN